MPTAKEHRVLSVDAVIGKKRKQQEGIEVMRYAVAQCIPSKVVPWSTAARLASCGLTNLPCAQCAELDRYAYPARLSIAAKWGTRESVLPFKWLTTGTREKKSLIKYPHRLYIQLAELLFLASYHNPLTYPFFSSSCCVMQQTVITNAAKFITNFASTGQRTEKYFSRDFPSTISLRHCATYIYISFVAAMA